MCVCVCVCVCVCMYVCIYVYIQYYIVRAINFCITYFYFSVLCVIIIK